MGVCWATVMDWDVYDSSENAHFTATDTREWEGFSGMLRVFYLSGFVARNLSGCHIAQGGQHEADKSATGDTEDEIRGSV